ncbi:MAG: hypothetical protein ABI054_11305, partial [Planctomycetota bacterium]
MEFHARDPQGDRDFGSFHESQPEPSFHSEDSSAPDPTSGAHEPPPQAGPSDPSSQDPERRRRRRGGRRRRAGGRADEVAPAERPGFDAELAVEPPLPEAEFPPFESGDGDPLARERFDAAADSGAVLDPARKRRRRGRRRGRGRAGDDQAAEDSPEGGAWPADASLAPDSDHAPGAASSAVEHPLDPLLAPPQTGRGSRRGGRGRRGSQRGERRDQAGVPDHAQPESDQGAAVEMQGGVPASELSAPRQERQRSDSSDPAGGGHLGKRRRRGSRGGRGRPRGQDETREPATPLGVEQIPFEEDDLPQAVIAPPPSRQAPKRKRNEPRERGRGRDRDRDRDRTADEGASEAQVEEREPARPAARRKNVILVNASDREEIRVAVVEGQQIVDFQMTVRKHKLLVNDIYRGRVVNLEPAIGAAFVDFGQGRNGFLHTSDVLSVYGEK